MGKSCIYHFSANPDKWVCKQHIEEIKAFAEKNGDYIDYIYLDSSLKQGEKTEYQKMKPQAADYDSIYVRDLYHINKWTLKAVADIKEIQSKGSTVNTMSSGRIQIEDGKDIFMKPKNILFYHSREIETDGRSFEVQKKIVEVFCREQTMWTIKNIIFEDADHTHCKVQKRLWELEDISQEYDLIVVQSFTRLDLRTANFEKHINRLGVDIYSMQEGLLKVRRKE